MAMSAMPLEENIQMSAWILKSEGMGAGRQVLLRCAPVWHFQMRSCCRLHRAFLGTESKWLGCPLCSTGRGLSFGPLSFP